MANVSCRRLRGSYPGGRSFKSRYVKGSTISKQESCCSLQYIIQPHCLCSSIAEKRNVEPLVTLTIESFRSSIKRFQLLSLSRKESRPSRISGDLDKARVIWSLLLKAMITGRLCSSINYEQ